MLAARLETRPRNVHDTRMGRPKGPDRERLHIAVLPETRRGLDRLSEASGRTMSQVVDALVSQALLSLPTPPEKKRRTTT